MRCIYETVAAAAPNMNRMPARCSPGRGAELIVYMEKKEMEANYVHAD